MLQAALTKKVVVDWTGAVRPSEAGGASKPSDRHYKSEMKTRLTSSLFIKAHAPPIPSLELLELVMDDAALLFTHVFPLRLNIRYRNDAITTGHAAWSFLASSMRR